MNLSFRMKVIEVRGKSTRATRKVYILLTQDMVNALDYIVTKRLHAKGNPFLFARKTATTPLDGCEAMRVVTERCPSLQHPSSIRSTTLRTYLATTAQVTLILPVYFVCIY